MKNKVRVYAPAPSATVRLVLASALLLGAALFTIAHAQLPPAQTSQGIEYVTGGFGSDASSAFKEAKPRYPLALTFAAVGEGGSAPYVADVKVEIADAQGKNVLEVPSAGPYLLVDLQPGSYTVRATYEGKTQTEQVKVAGPGSVDIRIAWKRPASGAD